MTKMCHQLICFVRSGAFTLEVHQAASQDLGFNELLPLNPFTKLVQVLYLYIILAG